MDGLAHAAVAAAPPAVALEHLKRAVHEQFGLDGDYAPLVSERDQNFHLVTASGEQYVVKVTSALEPALVSDFQIAALMHLQHSGLNVPKVIKTLDGGLSGKISDGESDCRLRLVNYLAGAPMAGVPISLGLASELGAELARLDIALRSFAHAGDRPVLLWDLQRAVELRALLPNIDDPGTHRGVSRALQDFEIAVVPALGKFRTQVIHGDANPGNILVDPTGGSVAGFIDFGDMLRAPLVFDVAIAASYLRGSDSAPLELMRPFLAGYATVKPLHEPEKMLLFDLVRTRLAMTVTLLFWRLGARRADDPYRKKTLQEEAGAIRFLNALDTLGKAGFLEQLI
ncbi:MAG: phosphotransferase [Woeseiaceae bacterium]